jgi:hypothetical protein
MYWYGSCISCTGTEMCSYISSSSTASTLHLPLYILSAVSAYQKAYGTGGKRYGGADGADGARHLCTVKSSSSSSSSSEV